MQYSKTCLKWPLKRRPNIGFQDRLLLNAGQKYCRMLQVEHSAIFSTFIKLLFVFKTFALSSFEWLLKTGFTVWPTKATSPIFTYLLCSVGESQSLISFVNTILKVLPSLDQVVNEGPELFRLWMTLINEALSSL